MRWHQRRLPSDLGGNRTKGVSEYEYALPYLFRRIAVDRTRRCLSFSSTLHGLFFTVAETPLLHGLLISQEVWNIDWIGREAGVVSCAVRGLLVQNIGHGGCLLGREVRRKKTHKVSNNAGVPQGTLGSVSVDPAG